MCEVESKGREFITVLTHTLNIFVERISGRIPKKPNVKERSKSFTYVFLTRAPNNASKRQMEFNLAF